MAGDAAPSPALAARMVQHLFDDRTPTRFDTALCVCPDPEPLLAALEEWAADSVARSLPELTVVAADWPADGDDPYPSVVDDVYPRAFLGGGPAVAEPCEFALCVPPDRAWADLDPETQAAIAETSAHVDDQTAPETTDVLYLEQALLGLAPDGVGVFLPRASLTTEAALSPYRQHLSERALDAEPVAEAVDGVDRTLVTVVGTDPHEFDGAPLSLEATPADVEDALATGVNRGRATALDAATPLAAMDVYAADDDASAVYLALIAEDYDAALVYEEPPERDGLVGYVARAWLRPASATRVRDLARPVADAPWVAADADLGAVIDRLGETRFAFVGEPDAIAGIVTRFDLNRLPVYQYLFERFARFETGLRQVIRAELDDWRAHCDSYRSVSVRDDLVVDELAQQPLGTLVTIVDGADLETAVLRDYHGFTAGFGDLRRLRNAVAHYNPLVHTMTDEPTSDERRRGARQLRAEHTLLQAAIDHLPAGQR